MTEHNFLLGGMDERGVSVSADVEEFVHYKTPIGAFIAYKLEP